MSSDNAEANKTKVMGNLAHNMVNILGVHIASTRLDEVLKKITEICSASHEKPFFITTINPEIVMLAQSDKAYRAVLNRADLALADGQGLKLADPSLQIVPGRRLVEKLLHHNYRIFFLGGVGDRAAQMARKYGGASDPGEANINDPQRNTEIVAKINKYSPDILLVAYGAPAQEQWLGENSANLKAKVVIGVGGAFDYLTGKAELPPEWLNAIGLEWAWRLVHEPWRFKRQLNLARFAVKVWLS